MFEIIGDFTPAIGDVVKLTRLPKHGTQYSIVGLVKGIEYSDEGKVESVSAYRVYVKTHKIMKSAYGCPKSFAFYKFHDNRIELINKGDGTVSDVL